MRRTVGGRDKPGHDAYEDRLLVSHIPACPMTNAERYKSRQIIAEIRSQIKLAA